MTQVKSIAGFSRTNPNSKNMWNPFTNEFFRSPGVLNTNPAVNVKESATGFHLEVAAPGLVKENFSVKLDENVLTISAKKETQADAEGQNWTRKEFSYSSFERSFKLPETISPEAIQAKYENGILMIEIPKKDISKSNPAKDIVIA